MSKLVIKKISAIIAVFCVVFAVYSVNFKANALTLTEMQTKANTFLSKGSGSSGNIQWSNVTNEFVDLGSILTTIGAGVMVGVTAYMGIKYLTSGPEAQAKLKGQLIGVVVSGMTIFGAYYIWKIVVSIAETF